MCSRRVSVALSRGLALLIVLVSAAAAAGQSSTATLSGVVLDEQRARLPGAIIAIKNVDTGSARSTMSAETGTFHLAGLTPGRYELRAERSGFAPAVLPLVLTVGQEAMVETVLRVAAVDDRITVSAGRVAGLEPTRTSLGRTFTGREIDDLPVPGRDFTTLATLTAGILPDLNQGGGSAPNLTGFASAAQTGRNNAILIDGLSHDDAAPGAMRGGLSLEVVKEFVVTTHGFPAEYGQAAGAVVNVVTRSGTNDYAARGFYYHRDDAWDATQGSAKLAVPPLDKSRLEQQTAGGFVGGPLARNRAFFFGSLEHLARDTDHVVTSAVLRVFRPNDPAILPQRTRNPNVLGRADVNLPSGHGLTFRYRLDDSTATNRFTEADVRLGTAERAHDLIRRDQDLGIVATHLLGTRGVNELRLMFARRFVDLNVDRYCPDCPAENRSSIRLGKSFNLPQTRTEDRWQIAETITWIPAERRGAHTVKAGFDVSVLRDDNIFPLNFAGTFTFNADRVFNAADATTYPTLYTGSAGSPEVRLRDDMYALFVQDQWRPASRVTVNAGLRWDYEDAPGIAHDRNNVAPRLGVSYDLTGSAKTVVRASYGQYYDQVFLIVAREVEQAQGLVQSRIVNPGYPDPFGPNENRRGTTPFIPSTTQYGPDMQTPYTAQATLGVQRELGVGTVISLDGVWARGYHLLASTDLNYPDLDTPGRPRPDPNVLVKTAYDTRGNSWYGGLEAALRRQHRNRWSYALAYALSSSERDTEDFRFMPQDMRDYDAERGPGANDSRHRLAANVNADVAFGLRVAGVLTARSALPYNIITGIDNNGDTFVTDRPPGVGRNAGRGDPFWQADLRLAKLFRLPHIQLELLGEAFNVTNRRNWIGHIGDRRSAQFGKPTAATGPREIQLGVRIAY